MFPTLFVWLGTFAVGVGVTSNPDLRWGPADGDAAVKAWMATYAPRLAPPPASTPRQSPRRVRQQDLRPILRGPMPKPKAAPKDVERLLHFELTSLEIPRISAFSMFIERWLRAEMARGWRTEGALGATGTDGRRSAVFSRRIRTLAPWRMPGIGRAVPCAPSVRRAATVACYFVESDQPGGVAQLKLGHGEYLPIHPRALVAVDLEGGALTARVRALVIVERAAIERFMQGAPRFRPYAAMFATRAKTEPVTVDHDRDGQKDAWLFEGGATFAVTPR